MSKAAIVRAIDAQVADLQRQHHILSEQATEITRKRIAAHRAIMAEYPYVSMDDYGMRSRRVQVDVARIDAARMGELDAATLELRTQERVLQDEKRALRVDRRTDWSARPVKETNWDRSGRVLSNR